MSVSITVVYITVDIDLQGKSQNLRPGGHTSFLPLFRGASIFFDPWPGGGLDFFNPSFELLDGRRSRGRADVHVYVNEHALHINVLL